MANNIILNHQEIEHKIRRISYQIFETFADENEIILSGIAQNGYVLAEKIAKVLKDVSEINVVLCEVIIDKKNPFKTVTTTIEKTRYENKGIVLIDDVLNTGNTLIYSVKHFLEVPIKKLKTAVLIDRNHKKYPVKVDFKGISLSTSLKDHVKVVFIENNNQALLL